MDVATKVMDSAATSTPSEAAEVEPTPSYLYRLLEEDTTVMRMAEPYFAPLGQSVRQWSEQGKETWVEMAIGDDRQDRVFAVSLGYAVVGLLLAIYLNILTVGTMRSAGRAVRSAIRQQLLVVKVDKFCFRSATMLTWCKGRCIHRHRVDHLPARLRHDARRVLRVDVPSWYFPLTSCVPPFRSLAGDLLPLGVGHYVHVRLCFSRSNQVH